MTKHYAVYYDNRLQKRVLTLSGAYSLIGRLAKERGWDITKLEVRQGCEMEVAQ